ncbi:MAG: hypothetical protein IAE80_16250 [Anaerolinea sp.]|nr:hypothetical protein [Anaerolinea sp.]
MGGQNEYILFDFPDGRLTDSAPILDLMGKIAHDDRFRFLKKAIVCDDSPGDLYVPNTPETLAGAWKNAQRALVRYGGYWMEFEDTEGVKLSFGYTPQEPRRFFLQMSSSVLNNRKQPENARAVASVIQKIYNTLHPHYGCGLFSYENHDSVEVCAPPFAIWDFNLFSPALVEQYGRDRLLALPAWRKVEFPDGGLMLEMSPNPLTESLAYRDKYREAANALGLDRIIMGG